MYAGLTNTTFRPARRPYSINVRLVAEMAASAALRAMADLAKKLRLEILERDQSVVVDDSSCPQSSVVFGLPGRFLVDLWRHPTLPSYTVWTASWRVGTGGP